MTQQTPEPAAILHCTQCGGELHPSEGQQFLTCPYCSATVYLDRSRVVFHWYLKPTLDEAQARATIARWMAGDLTVKDLDRKANIEQVSFQYFPLWYFKVKQATGEDVVLLEPAAATSVSELKSLRLPGGDLRAFDPSLDAQAVAPTVPLQTAQSWLAARNVAPDSTMEAALVHVPLFLIKYSYLNRIYTALVEASTGVPLANIYPAKPEQPYQLVGLAAAFVFLCLALFPACGITSGDVGSALLGFAAFFGVGIIAAAAIFAAAAGVASKV